jgi:hypothetical protein
MCIENFIDHSTLKVVIELYIDGAAAVKYSVLKSKYLDY